MFPRRDKLEYQLAVHERDRAELGAAVLPVFLPGDGPVVWCRRLVRGYRGTRTASSHSGYRSVAGERRTSSTTNPHFWRTRRDAPLLVVAVATSGRLATSSSCSASENRTSCPWVTSAF